MISLTFYMLVMIGSLLRFLPIQSPVSGPLSSVRHELPPCGFGLNLNQLLVNHPHKFCSTLMPTHLQAGEIVNLRFCVWVGVPIPILEALPSYRRWLISGSKSPILRNLCQVIFIDFRKFSLHYIFTSYLYFPILLPSIRPTTRSLLFPSWSVTN